MPILNLNISKEIKSTLKFRFLYYLVAGLSAPATAFFLNDIERGFYFTFISLVGIYSILDLGLGQTLLIIFSRDQSLELNNKKVKTNLKIVRIYYKFLAGIFVFSSIIFGWIFFGRVEQGSVYWQGPWFLTSLSTGILLLNSAKLIFLEASGKLANVANMRSNQTIIGNLILLILIILKFGLWSYAIYQLTLALLSSYFIYFSKESIIYRDGKKTKEKLNFKESIKLWKNEIFPLQWKISISYMCGIIIFQLITPFIFNKLGPSLAGVVGLNLNITNAIIVISTSFISASIPMLSKFAEEGKHNKVFNNFWELSKKSLIFGIALLTIGFLFSLKLHTNFPNIFLNPSITFLIAANSICHIYIYNCAAYFRTYKKEPIIIQSVISAILHLFIYLNINFLTLEKTFLLMLTINFIILSIINQNLNTFKKLNTKT